jgi:hypothetical protein
VLAGLVVLGTVLVSVTIARGRFLRQWGDAQRKLAATHAADALLGQWMAGPPGAVPVESSAALTDLPDCYWQTHRLDQPAAAGLSAAVVRLEIFQKNQSSREPMLVRAAPLVSVDFLVHVEPLRPAPPATSRPK